MNRNYKEEDRKRISSAFSSLMNFMVLEMLTTTVRGNTINLPV